MATALLVLADGFEEIEAVAVIDILRRGGVQVTVAGLSGQSVEGAHSITIQADTLFYLAKEADYDA
ncbi:MAG: 4-methyl-5(b-hydroxyethyl)-thiazole monophosphate biosynthesis, partial [Candidatus Marinamargulisbacteria bacterium]